jgi:hypothetical protein
LGAPAEPAAASSSFRLPAGYAQYYHLDPAEVHHAAERGIGGAGGALPHLAAIQRSFGKHDVSHVEAHTDSAAAEGSRAMGAEAFAVGQHVAFAGAPSLHAAAHEAAHVVQQRGGVQLLGGVGEAGDVYEQHADAVADLVVAGQSAESQLDQFGGSGGGRAVQRYSRRDGFKVSHSTEMAIEDQNEVKKFYAKPATLNRSIAILEGMKSKVTLQQGDAAPQALEGMFTVTPKRREDNEEYLFDSSECNIVADRVTNSGQSDAVYQPLGGEKTVAPLNPFKTDPINKLIELLTKDGQVSPQQVVAAQKGLEGDDEESTFRFKMGEVDVDTNKGVDASNALKEKLPNRNFRVALLLNVLRDEFAKTPMVQQDVVDQVGLLLQRIQLEVSEEKKDSEVEKWTKEITGLIAQTKRQRSRAYSELGGEEKSRRAGNLGINEHARPDVGESYATVGSRERAQQENDKWSFHFAAVVARDEEDSVTLENYNRHKGTEGQGEWYFDMQGPREQSFHEKHKDTVADGVTLRMGEKATPDMRQQFRLRIEEKLAKEAPGEIVARLEKAVTRAELAAIYADAIKDQ